MKVYYTDKDTPAYTEWLKTQGPSQARSMNAHMYWSMKKRDEYEKLFGISSQERTIQDIREELSFSEWAKANI